MLIKPYFWLVRANAAITKGTIGFSGVQRILLNFSLNEDIKLRSYRVESTNVYLASMKLDVDFLQSKLKKGTRYTQASSLL